MAGLFVIASILGSTDPIAVGALLKELGAPHKLNMLLEGEALLNDGTSLITYQTFILIYEGRFPGIAKTLFNLFTLCVGGPFLGLVVGLIFVIWMRKIIKDGVLIVTMTFINCFLVFFLCEYFPWNLSGILAIVTSSIILASKGKMDIMADELWAVVETVWKFAQFVGESMLFVLTGIFIGRNFVHNRSSNEDFFFDVVRVVVFFFLMTISRFLMVMLFIPFYNSKHNKQEYKIGVKESFFISYSGIRGAFPLIICLLLAQNENFSVEFRKLAILVTIITIFMGVIFNGITINYVISYLNIIPVNPVVENLKSIIQKDIYNQSLARLDELRAKPELSAANWGLVQELCGFSEQFRYIGKMERSRHRKTIMLISNSSNAHVLIETRVRVIYFFKSLVLINLREAFCSSEAAHVLIELADMAEESSGSELGLWRLLEEYLRSMFVLNIINYLRQFKNLEAYLRTLYNQELSGVYEILYNFVNNVDVIISNRKELYSLPSAHVDHIIRELEEQKEKAKGFISELTRKNSVVIQLYQTKRACKEIINFRRKTIKGMKKTGVIEQREYEDFMHYTKKLFIKIENFGFNVNDNFIKEIFNSSILFAPLNVEDKERLFRSCERRTFQPEEYLFRKGDQSKGIYFILDGSVEEEYPNNTTKLRFFGSVLGIFFYLDDN